MATALIVVDVQNGFLREGNLASERCLAALPAVQAEVDAALDRGWPVIFTADTHVPNDREFEVFPVHCVEGTSEADLVDELRGYLERPNVHLVRKRRYSALFDTDLGELLERLGVDDVRICGVCTDICVLHTTADLRNRDITVTVAAQATATFDAPGHDGDAVQRFSVAHMRGILGATVEA